MDASGHHSIATAVGERVLVPALARAGHVSALPPPRPNAPSPPMRIGAFYLGNWLTDMSQAVDPVAYESAEHGLSGILATITSAFDRLKHDAPSWLTSIAGGAIATLERALDRALEALKKSVRVVVHEGRGSGLANAFRSVFRFIGYAKFVLDERGGETKMDKSSFYAVYQSRYTQYYPHEHLDRPVRSDGSRDTTIAAGPRSGRPIATPAADLYAYLRDDIEMIAGLLSHLDGGLDQCRLSWAAATFHPRPFFSFEDGSLHPVADNSLAWNIELAKLGHALHGIEDYFAHSNFVEHTNAVLPREYKRFERLEHRERIERRLRRWISNPADESSRSFPAEPHVVTGTFDFVDTFQSLAHLLIKLRERPHRTAGQTADAILEFKYTKLLRDTLELIENPAEVWEQSDPSHEDYDEDTANMCAKWMREQAGHNLTLAQGNDPRLEQILGYVLRHPLLANVDPQAKLDFEHSVRSLGRVVGGVGMGIMLYSALKNVADFFDSPLAFLKGFIRHTVWRQLVEHGEVYITNFVLNMLGGDRVGSHSLIAKDTGPEVLHDAAMECAKAVHKRVCDVMVRHASHRNVEICVAGDGFAQSVRSSVARGEWVDWLAMLESFLSHPFGVLPFTVTPIEIPVRVFHITAATSGSTMSSDTLASLAAQYDRTRFRGEGAPPQLTWRHIADANFPTTGLTNAQAMDRINRALGHAQTGVLTQGGVNYAFKPNIRLVIPWQSLTTQSMYAASTSMWWYSVIVNGANQGTRGAYSPPLVPHAQLRARLDRGAQLREAAENAYVPPRRR